MIIQAVSAPHIRCVSPETLASLCGFAWVQGWPIVILSTSFGFDLNNACITQLRLPSGGTCQLPIENFITEIYRSHNISMANALEQAISDFHQQQPFSISYAGTHILIPLIHPYKHCDDIVDEVIDIANRNELTTICMKHNGSWKHLARKNGISHYGIAVSLSTDVDHAAVREMSSIGLVPDVRVSDVREWMLMFPDQRHGTDLPQYKSVQDIDDMVLWDYAFETMQALPTSRIIPAAHLRIEDLAVRLHDEQCRSSIIRLLSQQAVLPAPWLARVVHINISKAGDHMISWLVHIMLDRRFMDESQHHICVVTNDTLSRKNMPELLSPLFRTGRKMGVCVLAEAPDPGVLGEYASCFQATATGDARNCDLRIQEQSHTYSMSCDMRVYAAGESVLRGLYVT